jgi:predicted AAA+ superfamily ATPase
MYKRSQYNILLSRKQKPRRFIQAVVDPRQVGKSTMVKQVLQDCGGMPVGDFLKVSPSALFE